jgi:hypothetical protein
MMGAVFDERICDRRGRRDRGQTMVTIKSSQKTFTEEEISGLTGICREHLRDLARSKHLGSIARAAGDQAERLLFTNSDLMVLAVLVPRCQH